MKPKTDIYWGTMHLNALTQLNLLAGWAAGTSTGYKMTISVLGENPIQTIVQTN